MAGAGLLGAPAADGGFGDEQAMRILMLLARTGPARQRDLPARPRPAAAAAPAAQLGGRCAGDGDERARSPSSATSRPKIDGAPDTILVDAEIVAIIRAQQHWARRYFAEHGAPGTTPKYLFLAAQNEPQRRPALLRSHPAEPVDRAGRSAGRARQHRRRWSTSTAPTASATPVATTLLNAGVPLHVVQRYLGHLTPTMTMTYAQTLQSTAEAEFLRYRKITADARDLEIDPHDLYDMLELDRRTDRILPNGWCLLPPRQSCGKGNACLTCDKFATDATFLPELQAPSGPAPDSSSTNAARRSRPAPDSR